MVSRPTALRMSESKQLTQGYFELFGLPEDYAVDRAQLSDSYRVLQQRFHPDGYVGKSVTEQRLAMQMSARVNEAYQTLSSPIKRAEYLLQSRGQGIASDNQRVDDIDFLQRQLDLREQLGSADQAELAVLADEAAAQIRHLGADFAAQYGADRFEDARQTVSKMQFFDKLAAQITEREAVLDDF